VVAGEPGGDQQAAAGPAQRLEAAGAHAQVEDAVGGDRVDALDADPGAADADVAGQHRQGRAHLGERGQPGHRRPRQDALQV